MEKAVFTTVKSCKAGASLFLGGKHPTTPFQQSRKCCERRAGLLKCQKRSRKQFAQLCGPVKLVLACVCAANTLQRRFDGQAGVLKHVQVSLCPNTHRESNLHHCGGTVKLVQACFCAENTLQLRFSRRGGAEMHQQACLSASTDGESSFHYCGSPVKL